MPNPPRTREFYRPLLEDIHVTARDWRMGLSRLELSEVLLIAAMLLAGPVLVFSLVQYAASMRSELVFVPADTPRASDRGEPATPVTVEDAVK